MNKKFIIEGFKEPTLPKNSHLVLADVRGDGEGKLVIWSEESSQLIVYKGSNRELEKPVKLRNVTSILQFQDEENSCQSVIALAAENCLYLFRGLSESFRLKVPDVFASAEEQILWSQFENEPERLSEELAKLNPSILSMSAKYLLCASTTERKKELIRKSFTIGINEKDSISAVGVIRNNELSPGNVVLGTELGHLYILDNYAHSILQQKTIGFAPSIILAYGSIVDKYVMVCIGRDGEISLYLQNDTNEPSEHFKSSTRIVGACLSYPDFIFVTSDQLLTHYTISNSNIQLLTRKYNLKLNEQPIGIELIKIKHNKMIVLIFKFSFKFYHEKELRYVHHTDSQLYKIIYGSFAREESCLILLYETAGFEVLILHRQFSFKENYGSNRLVKKELNELVLPKKSTYFKEFWDEPNTDDAIAYRLYDKSLKLLKWRTLRERISETGQLNHRIQTNSKILGLGPLFHIKFEVENTTEEVIFDITLIAMYNKEHLRVNCPTTIAMLTPLTPYNVPIEATSLTFQNEKIIISLSWSTYVIDTVVNIHNCEEFGN